LSATTTQKDDERVQRLDRERRNRAINRAATSTVALRLVNAVSSLVLFPIVLHHLGAASFGVWITITSFTALFAFADLGIGAGLLSKLSAAYGKDNSEEGEQVVATAVVIAMVISLLVALLGSVVLHFTHWHHRLLATDTLKLDELDNALRWFLFGFSTSIVLSLIHRAQLGTQQGHISARWQILGAVGSILGVLAAVHFGGGLAAIVLGQTLPVVMAGILNAGHYWLSRGRFPRHVSLTAFDAKTARSVLQIGAFFFVMQCSMAIAFSSDVLLIAASLGADAVAPYAVAAKLFSIISILLGAYSQALWPAYGEANSRGDLQWIEKTLRATRLIFPLLAAVGAFLLMASWKPLTILWLTTPPTISFGLIAAFAAWVISEAIGHAYSAFLNGVGIVRIQLTLAVAFSLLTFIAMWITIPSFGPLAAILSRTVCYVLIVITSYVILVPKLYAYQYRQKSNK
jgi:O-antigen/teichoic acid export membrane protein